MSSIEPGHSDLFVHFGIDITEYADRDKIKRPGATQAKCDYRPGK